MSKQFYIKGKYEAPKLPLLRAVTVWLALDHFGAPQWLYGAFGVLFLIITISETYRLIAYEAAGPVFK